MTKYDIEKDIRPMLVAFHQTVNNQPEDCRDATKGMRAALNASSAVKELRAAQERIEELEERLEITHCYTEGKKIEIPEDERDDFPDGIYCRDETIKLLQNIIDTHRKECEAFGAAPDKGMKKMSIDEFLKQKITEAEND